MIKKKKILLVICGGIAAYKSLDLIRLLLRKNYEVKTILTKSGKKFVTPLSLATLTKDKPYQNLFDMKDNSKIDHISLSRWADIILVLPATANFMSKLNRGNANDLASTVILASNKNIFLIPAMNVRMWLHPATQKNFKDLIGYGYKFIGPENGEMACGEYGKGKMSSPRQIFSEIQHYFKDKNKFKEKKIKVLITAGPTREYIDPIRFISNESSGKQGYELAKCFKRFGIDTTLVLGPTNLNVESEIKTKNVISAKQMLDVVKKSLPVDIAVCVAAVSDFKPLKYENKKIKKTEMFKNLKLEKNPDILEYLGKTNKNRPKIVVGFSAETENFEKNSEDKLRNKNCDMIISNDVSKKNIGFNSDFNKITIINSDGKKLRFNKNKKNYLAYIIAREILSKFLSNGKNLN
tara:strand:+ start:2331 stop:3554 length:1224 start_codon:yes stop_codon:yes gene_type:complete